MPGQTSWPAPRAHRLATLAGASADGTAPVEEREFEPPVPVVRSKLGTHCPSCLIEGEFIHTIHGAELIKNDNKRQLMALAVALGVKKFLGVGNSSDQDRQDYDFLASIRVIEKELEAIKKHI